MSKYKNILSKTFNLSTKKKGNLGVLTQEEGDRC